VYTHVHKVIHNLWTNPAALPCTKPHTYRNAYMYPSLRVARQTPRCSFAVRDSFTTIRDQAPRTLTVNNQPPNKQTFAGITKTDREKLPGILICVTPTHRVGSSFGWGVLLGVTLGLGWFLLLVGGGV